MLPGLGILNPPDDIRGYSRNAELLFPSPLFVPLVRVPHYVGVPGVGVNHIL